MQRRLCLLILVDVLMVVFICMLGVLPSTSHGASGVVFTKTVTFAQNGSAQVDFVVNGPKSNNAQTLIWLEYGSDHPGTVLPGPFSGVTITLSKGGATPITLTPVATSVTYQTNKMIDFHDRSATADAPRVWELVITHTDIGSGTPGVAIPIGSSETWNIAISGFPAGPSPAARFIASIQDPTGNFTNLSTPPKGPSGGAVSSTISNVSVSGSGSAFTATISNGAAGQVWEAVREDYATSFSCSPLSGSVTAGSSSTATVTCTWPSSFPCCEIATMRFDLKASAAGPVLSSNRRSTKLHGNCGGGVFCPNFKFWDRFVVFEPWKKWCPRCPLPCLNCPVEWKTPVADGFQRALIRLSPEVLAEGQRELSENTEALKLEGSDFKEIGPWVKDPMTGQSLKLIEYALGAVPRVRLTDGKQTSQEILVADTVDGKQGGEVLSLTDGTAGDAGMYKAFLGITAALLLIALVTIVVLLKKIKAQTGSR